MTSKTLESKNGTVKDVRPIDGGWGWLIVLGASFIIMLCSSQAPCFGNLFKQKMDSEGAPHYLPALIFNLQGIIWNILGSWSGILGRQFGIRKVATIGAIISSSSILLSATVTNPFLFLASFSLLSGVGGGLVVTLSLYIIPIYFDKRLGLANGIAGTFGSLGRILMPQIAVYLQDEYSFTGATLITGGIVMQTIWCTLLYHPLSWHQLKPRQEDNKYSNYNKNNINDDDKFLPEINRTQTSASLVTPANKNLKLFSKRIRSYSENVNDRDVQTLMNAATLDNKSYSATKLSQVSLSGSDLLASYMALHKVETRLNSNNTLPQTLSQQGVFQQYLAVFKNMHLIKDPQAIGLAAITCIVIVTGFNFVGLLPFILSEAGYNEWEIATAMSVQSFSDLAIKMILSCTLDRCCIHSKYIYFSGQIILLITPPLLLLAKGHWTLVLVSSILYGVGLGIIHILDSYIVVKTLGSELLQSVYGVSQLLRSAFYLIIGICLGVLPQITESYMSSLLFITIMQAIAISLAVFVAVLSQKRTKLNENKS